MVWLHAFRRERKPHGLLCCCLQQNLLSTFYLSFVGYICLICITGNCVSGYEHQNNQIYTVQKLHDQSCRASVSRKGLTACYDNILIHQHFLNREKCQSLLLEKLERLHWEPMSGGMQVLIHVHHMLWFWCVSGTVVRSWNPSSEWTQRILLSSH